MSYLRPRITGLLTHHTRTLVWFVFENHHTYIITVVHLDMLIYIMLVSLWIYLAHKEDQTYQATWQGYYEYLKNKSIWMCFYFWSYPYIASGLLLALTWRCSTGNTAHAPVNCRHTAHPLFHFPFSKLFFWLCMTYLTLLTEDL